MTDGSRSRLLCFVCLPIVAMVTQSCADLSPRAALYASDSGVAEARILTCSGPTFDQVVLEVYPEIGARDNGDQPEVIDLSEETSVEGGSVWQAVDLRDDSEPKVFEIYATGDGVLASMLFNVEPSVLPEYPDALISEGASLDEVGDARDLSC